MSNTNTELIDKQDDFAGTSSLRSNDLAGAVSSTPTAEIKATAQVPKIKAPIPNPNPNAAPASPANEVAGERVFSLAEVMAISKQIEANLRKELALAGFVPGATQVMPKDKAPISIDFSKLTMEDIYDLSIPIQAKAFGATDALRVELQDKNYEARWVNKNPRRLGQFLAFGFTYVEEKDLARKLEVEVVSDAQGHFVLDDVVLMRITKEKYYAALRSAHERAVRTVNSVEASKAAEKEATNYMSKVGGNEFANAANEGKVGFYRPGIEI